MSTASTPLLFPGPLSGLPPLSPKPTLSTPNCIDRYENEPPTQVLPFLYVGNARDSTNSKLLQELGIRYILSVTTHSPNSSFSNSNSSSTINELKIDGEFRTKWIPVSDNLSENLAPYFEDACSFIGTFG